MDDVSSCVRPPVGGICSPLDMYVLSASYSLTHLVTRFVGEKQTQYINHGTGDRRQQSYVTGDRRETIMVAAEKGDRRETIMVTGDRSNNRYMVAGDRGRQQSYGIG